MSRDQDVARIGNRDAGDILITNRNLRLGAKPQVHNVCAWKDLRECKCAIGADRKFERGGKLFGGRFPQCDSVRLSFGIPVTWPLTLTAGGGPFIASSMSNSAISAGAISTDFAADPSHRTRSIGAYILEVDPMARPRDTRPEGAAPERFHRFGAGSLAPRPGAAAGVGSTGRGVTFDREGGASLPGERISSCSWRSRLQQQKNRKHH